MANIDIQDYINVQQCESTTLVPMSNTVNDVEHLFVHPPPNALFLSGGYKLLIMLKMLLSPHFFVHPPLNALSLSGGY